MTKEGAWRILRQTLCVRAMLSLTPELCAIHDDLNLVEKIKSEEC